MKTIDFNGKPHVLSRITFREPHELTNGIHAISEKMAKELNLNLPDNITFGSGVACDLSKPPNEFMIVLVPQAIQPAGAR